MKFLLFPGRRGGGGRRSHSASSDPPVAICSLCVPQRHISNIDKLFPKMEDVAKGLNLARWVMGAKPVAPPIVARGPPAFACANAHCCGRGTCPRTSVASSFFPPCLAQNISPTIPLQNYPLNRLTQSKKMTIF